MDANLALVISAVSRFERYVSESAGFTEDMAGEYNRLKRALASSFQEMALEALPQDAFDLKSVKLAVVEEMHRLFEGKVDSSLFVVRGYTSPHPEVYALLASRVGEVIPGWRIRLLSRDAIETERRTRELRELGLDLQVSGAQDDAQYSLASLNPDLAYGAAFQLRKNAINASLSQHVRVDIVWRAEQVAALPKRRKAL